MAGLKGNLENGWSWDLAFTWGRNDFLLTSHDGVRSRLDSAIQGLGGPGCDAATGTRDLIILASFVGDDAVYGGAGVPVLVSGANGYGASDEILGADPFVPQREFVLGGIVAADIAAIAGGGLVGGSVRQEINSFWITEGIPSFDQVSDFFSQSMQAGQVIPQAWAPVRTAANPNPATPDSPTGHHWTVSDLALVDGIGGTWTDRIGGIVLEREGVEGDAREIGRGHNYWMAL